MLNLNDRQWKEFFICGEKGLFRIKASNSGIDKNKLLNSDNNIIPYVTRSDINNGISQMVGVSQIRSQNSGNVITIGLDTQTAFYQGYNFYTGQNIQVLDSDYMNKYVALFLIPLLKKQLKKFCWGSNGATLGRLRRTKIILPVNNDNKPDYNFMEQYIRDLINRKYDEYRKFLNKNKQTSIKSLPSKNWKMFKVGDLFHTNNKTGAVPTGAYIPKQYISDGFLPRVTVKTTNNAIDSFIKTEHKNLRQLDNFISVSFLGDAFYHQYNASLDMKVHGLRLKNKELNKDLALFIVASLYKNINDSSYGNQLSSTDLPKKSIILPVDDFGLPDYDYMAQYIKNKMLDKYSAYLRHINKL